MVTRKRKRLLSKPLRLLLILPVRQRTEQEMARRLAVVLGVAKIQLKKRALSAELQEKLSALEPPRQHKKYKPKYPD